MDSHKAKPQDFIIKEGEPGEVLYIVESGEMTCSKIINEESKILKKYSEGDVFGELALLYNAPRAATI
jgi:cAMP-dependent protein kinase regulator